MRRRSTVKPFFSRCGSSASSVPSSRCRRTTSGNASGSSNLILLEYLRKQEELDAEREKRTHDRLV